MQIAQKWRHCWMKGIPSGSMWVQVKPSECKSVDLGRYPIFPECQVTKMVRSSVFQGSLLSKRFALQYSRFPCWRHGSFFSISRFSPKWFDSNIFWFSGDQNDSFSNISRFTGHPNASFTISLGLPQNIYCRWRYSIYLLPLTANPYHQYLARLGQL